jgi:N-ethylmaleimide reductase
VPNDLLVEYYTKRAQDAALVFTECSTFRPDGNSFIGSGSIDTEEQIQGWKRVTDSVHSKGGYIFHQIWHGGRASHPDQIGGETPLSSSEIAINGTLYTPKGKRDHVKPRAATIDEIQQLVKDFRRGAENAKRAGFDGTELHGANGYIIDQFLRDSVNKRTDEYGGSIPNRCRLLLEVIDQLIEVFGANRTGVKLSPVCDYNDIYDSDPFGLVDYLIEELNKRNIAFIEFSEAITFDPATAAEKAEKLWAGKEHKSFREIYKSKFNGAWITNYQMNFE